MKNNIDFVFEMFRISKKMLQLYTSRKQTRNKIFIFYNNKIQVKAKMLIFL